jgi:hypothetical protein
LRRWRYSVRDSRVSQRRFWIGVPPSRLGRRRIWCSPPPQSGKVRSFASLEPVLRKSGARFTSISALSMSCCKTILGRGNGERSRC